MAEETPLLILSLTAMRGLDLVDKFLYLAGVDMPALSVIIPVYNARRFVRQAVESVLAERLRNMEVIVIDDGSTDGSTEALRDLPIRTLVLSSNSGPAAATNAGLEIAMGEFVAFLDADDVLYPGSLEWRLDWMKNHPNAPAVAGRPAAIIDEAGKIIPEFKHVLHPNYQPPNTLSLDYFKNGGAYPVTVWIYMFRKSLFDTVGVFDESLKMAQDFDFILRVLEKYSIPVQFDPTVYRRIHKENMSLETRGRVKLNEETIGYCKKVASRYGIEPDHWNVWETGYTC